MAFASGTIGTIKITGIHAGANLGMKEWSFNCQTNVIPVNTFLSAYQATTFGITKTDVSGSGPWSDTDALQGLTTGAVYSMEFGITAAISLEADIRISNFEIKDDAEGNPTYSFAGTSEGVFEPIFV